ncbi:MAG: hypothetical protein ACYS6Z_14455 [Planctomycetota bacterium]|jgi:hypothetical protein
MRRLLRRLFEIPGRYHFWGSTAILLVAVYVISAQLADRAGFANSRLREDVMERWGAPIAQSAPSVRYVESGSIFNTLEPLALDGQRVFLDAVMSYRKRGLVYFSGFEFALRGEYAITNPRPHEIDVVFVFPLEQARRSMVRDLRFLVDGEPAEIPLSEQADKLVWTGRLAPGESAAFEIGFRGRGLDSFRYALDPELPVRNFELHVDIEGGDNYDYQAGVVPATSTRVDGDRVALAWEFDSPEAGFPFGVILPSEKSFDQVILRMIRRAWATFALFLVALIGLATYHRRPLTRIETYLASTGYAFFFVLLPYLAAYLHFYVAYALTALVIGGLLQLYLARVFPAGAAPQVAAAVVALLWVPTAAVVLVRHTGLIYALEILAGLALLMFLSMRPAVREAAQRLEDSLHANRTEDSHV